MALTDNCDLYAAISEDGVNAVIRHIMQQRPSLVNYATAYIADRPRLACEPVARTPDVDAYGNSLFTVEGPVPLLGVDAPPVGLNYSAQLTWAEIDFYPGSAFALPDELDPPLAEQRLAISRVTSTESGTDHSGFPAGTGLAASRFDRTSGLMLPISTVSAASPGRGRCG